MNKKILPLLSLALWMSIYLYGCSAVKSADELLTLKRLSDEQSAMAKEVAAYNESFEQLVAAVKAEEMGRYATKRKVQKAFGKPILTREERRGGKDFDVWLYRYSTQFFGSDKVYLYFDRSGTLKEWELKEGNNEQIRQKTAK